mmetsp:Transcript_25175/g.54769  ORF Transcript_25175/g.54769 Transcript_25175/m.54769 type:complete len:263 (-) Transcript_25175:40-828(-)
MTDFSQEDMLTYSAQIRAKEIAKEKVAERQAKGPREEDMTIGEALEEISTTMQTDKFWGDMAKPLIVAIATLKDGSDADQRTKAAKAVRDCIEQIENVKHYFQTEQPILEQIAGLLEDDSQSGTLETKLLGVKTTWSPETEAALAKGIDDSAGKEQRAMDAAEGPWTFTETPNKQEISVSIPVPPDTQKGDVKVVFGATTLKVSVKGHERQPFVIDGTLAGAVDLDSCSWVLEGNGEKRKLTLDMDKTMGGLMWNRLLGVSR